MTMSQKYSDEERALRSQAYAGSNSREYDNDEPEDERLYNRAWQNEVLAKLAAKDAERKRERDEINNLLRGD